MSATFKRGGDSSAGPFVGGKLLEDGMEHVGWKVLGILTGTPSVKWVADLSQNKPRPTPALRERFGLALRHRTASNCLRLGSEIHGKVLVCPSGAERKLPVRHIVDVARRVYPRSRVFQPPGRWSKPGL